MTTRLFIVTDERTISFQTLTERLALLAEEDLASDVTVVLRDPLLSSSVLFERSKLLRTITRSIGARLLIDDRVDLAVLVDADGIHLGRTSLAIEDLPSKLRERTGFVVSVSCHAIDELSSSRVAGADVVMLSPIFDSPGKGAPIGAAVLAVAKERLDELPRRPSLVALGGVDETNAAWCIANGADAVSAIRGEPSAILRALRRQNPAVR